MQAGDGVRLLLVTGSTASDAADLPSGILALIEGASEILVVSPALPSRIDWLTSATDSTRQIADERLSIVLDQLEDTAASVEGKVGADDPMLAFEDAIADFHPDHLLIALRGPDDSDWQERGLIEAVFSRFGLPVTVFRISG